MNQLQLPEKSTPRVQCITCSEPLYVTKGQHPTDAVAIHYAREHPDVVCKVDRRQFKNQAPTPL